MAADFELWWIRGNEERPVDESRSIVLQSMRGDRIVPRVGPLVVEFKSNEEKNAFFDNGLAQLIRSLNAKPAFSKKGIDFLPINAKDPRPFDDGEFGFDLY